MPDEGGIRGLFAVSTMHGVVAPRAVVVGRGERAVRVQQRNDVALRVEDVVIERRGRAVVVDHGERLVAVVIHELEGLIAPSLPHDLAGKRCVVVRRAVDRFTGADTGHVVSIGDLLAVDRRGGELAALRPREGIVLAVVVRDRVAGGRKVARPGLALVENVLRGAAGCHAREQIGPRGVRVAEGLCDRAVFCNTPDVARRVVGAAAQRDTADNDDDLWLCADGCTHHSDHLSISQRAVLIHRPQGTRKSNAPIIFCASVSLDYPLNCSHAQSQLHLPFLTIEEFRLSGYKDNEKLASSAAWSEAHLRAQTQESASGAFRLTRTG